MTTIAQKISETPMAPYADLLRSMEPRDIRIVVTFLQEVMDEVESKTAADAIRRKFKKLNISQETKDLVNGLSLSAEEMRDDRTKYVLGYK